MPEMKKTPPVGISALAAQEIRKIMATKNIPANYGLRIGVRGSGCSAGLMLGFDHAQPHDEQFEIAGIPVFIDKRHTLYVIGKEVDFRETEEERGFFFQEQPIATSGD